MLTIFLTARAIGISVFTNHKITPKITSASNIDNTGIVIVFITVYKIVPLQYQ